MNRILVVSPEPMVHGFWTGLLRQRGYEVGERCWKTGNVSEESYSDPSLILFDLVASTPLSTVCDALEGIRDEYPGAPLVMLIPASLPDLYLREFEGRCNGCLRKPVDCGALLRLVDMFVHRQIEKRQIERAIFRAFSLSPA